MQKCYIIKQTDENTWVIVDNETGETINIITKNIVVNYCKNECEINDIEFMSKDGIANSVWWELNEDYDLEFVDNYCQEFEKFLSWLDYICVEYFANEIVAIYKQRLLNFK